MTEPKFKRHLRDARFLRNHQLSRRNMLRFGAAGGGLALAGRMPGGLVAPAMAQDEITGGPLEVGVLQEDPHPWFQHAKQIGDSLEADYEGTEITYTFANTASDPARALRWQNGDPLDVDTGRWSNQAPPTWDWPDNGFVLDLTPYVEEPNADGEVWADVFTQGAKSFAVDTREGTETPGAWWGIPYEMVLMLMHYNVAAFEEMGLEIPTNWDEFLAVCEAIDGASPIRTYWQVMLPLTRPGIASLLILNFLTLWNEFFYALLFIRERSEYTVTLGLTYLDQQATYSGRWVGIFAGMTLTMIPVLIIFAILQQQITKGLTVGAIKG